ncbi:hypothetical protein GCM10009122_21920 [Fulvivirga kasyanovii]|uniref:DUF5017 domain-containing protein n=1 Tax=Fulvivirga kasyanovii TaxID=396812 RepID=A0ABW9RXN5_9BACT|nr:hypothetical protein [Fulvivirga kasyanovii]MTI28525.1 hypothetical protein [Fulvivirga kasyanovii]
MKKYIIYFYTLMMITFISCDPLDETYEELDELIDDPTAAQVLEITLTDDEYDLLEEEGVAKYGNFESEDEAKTYIPLILERAYPQLGNGSSVLVTYDLYNPIRINNAVELSLTEAEYDSIGENHPDKLLGTDSTYLTSESDIFKAVEYVYTAPENEDVVTLTYDYRNESVSEERESKLVYYASQWLLAYEPTTEDYNFMGQTYPNFDSRSLARERIAFLFDRLFPFGEEGDIRASIFTYTYEDDNDTPDDDEDDFRVFEDFLAIFIHNGETWVPQQDAMPQSLQFGNEDGVWVPDNTIRYTLSAPDYTFVANNPDLGTEASRGNLSSFGNFSTLSGYWTSEDIIEAIGAILKNNFPNSEVGQKYLVTYNTYPAGFLSVHLILNDEGNYVVVE